MVLPHTVFFPHNLIPLHIFEPRYCAMLEKALESDRVFAVSLARLEEDEFAPNPVGGMGLIRACVRNADGTSNVVLQGLARIRFIEFTQKTPYYIGKVELVSEEENYESEDYDALISRIIAQINAICRSNPQPVCGIHGFLAGIKNYNLLTDIIAGTFLHRVARRQLILETTSTRKRLQLLASSLKEEYPSG